jgi:type IV pilus assembly protein PilV
VNRRARGFTLVESMVALVVLAVGMLGIAGLYVTTLRSGSSAIYRMQAINVATDMADRIRANRDANVFYTNAPANNNCFGTLAVVCNPQQMAQSDLFFWNAQLAQVLPNGAGTVLVNGASAPYSYTITVTWYEQGSDVATAGTAQSYQLQMQI